MAAFRIEEYENYQKLVQKKVKYLFELSLERAKKLAFHKGKKQKQRDMKQKQRDIKTTKQGKKDIKWVHKTHFFVSKW